MIRVSYTLCPVLPTKNLLSKVYNLLPPKVALAAHDFGPYRRKLSFLLGRLMLQEMLDIDLTSILVNPYGKPYLPDGGYFNISYSNGLVICAVSESFDIGVDVEYIRKDVAIDHYFSVLNKNDSITISKARNPAKAFYKIWTAKESVMKADGRGFNIGMKNIMLHDTYALIASESKKWYIQWFEPISHYQIALCSKGEMSVELYDFDIMEKVN